MVWFDSSVQKTAFWHGKGRISHPQETGPRKSANPSRGFERIKVSPNFSRIRWSFSWKFKASPSYPQFSLNLSFTGKFHGLKNSWRLREPYKNDEIITYPFSLPSLLKTFSKTPFHGQYLKRAETTMMAPINPTPNQNIPEMKKERTIRMLPKMVRTTDSCFPTFLLLIIGVTSSLSSFFSLVDSFIDLLTPKKDV